MQKEANLSNNKSRSSDKSPTDNGNAKTTDTPYYNKVISVQDFTKRIAEEKEEDISKSSISEYKSDNLTAFKNGQINKSVNEILSLEESNKSSLRPKLDSDMDDSMGNRNGYREDSSSNRLDSDRPEFQQSNFRNVDMSHKQVDYSKRGFSNSDRRLELLSGRGNWEGKLTAGSERLNDILSDNEYKERIKQLLNSDASSQQKEEEFSQNIKDMLKDGSYMSNNENQQESDKMYSKREKNEIKADGDSEDEDEEVDYVPDDSISNIKENESPFYEFKDHRESEINYDSTIRYSEGLGFNNRFSYLIDHNVNDKTLSDFNSKKNSFVQSREGIIEDVNESFDPSNQGSFKQNLLRSKDHSIGPSMRSSQKYKFSDKMSQSNRTPSDKEDDYVSEAISRESAMKESSIKFLDNDIFNLSENSNSQDSGGIANKIPMYESPKGSTELNYNFDPDISRDYALRRKTQQLELVRLNSIDIENLEPYDLASPHENQSLHLSNFITNLEDKSDSSDDSEKEEQIDLLDMDEEDEGAINPTASELYNLSEQYKSVKFNYSQHPDAESNTNLQIAGDFQTFKKKESQKLEELHIGVEESQPNLEFDLLEEPEFKIKLNDKTFNDYIDQEDSDSEESGEEYREEEKQSEMHITRDENNIIEIVEGIPQTESQIKFFIDKQKLVSGSFEFDEQSEDDN